MQQYRHTQPSIQVILHSIYKTNFIMKNRIFTKLSALAGPALLLLFLVVSTRSNATAISAIATGNWSATSTWSTGAVPTSSDAVTIAGGFTVTSDATGQVCASLTLGDGASHAGTLAFAASGSPSVAVSGAITVDAAPGLGTITVASGATLSATGAIACGGHITNNGTVTCTLTSATDITGAGTFTNAANSSLSVATGGANNAISVTTFTTTANGNTVTYTGTASYFVHIGTYYNLTINSGNTGTLGGATTVSGTLTLTAGQFAASTKLTMGSGAQIVRSGGTITGTLQGTNAYDVTYNGALKTMGPEVTSAGATPRNITMNMATAGTALTAATCTITGNITATQGTFTPASTTITLNGTTESISGNAVSFNNLTIAGTATVTTSVNISVAGALTVNGILNPGASNPVSGAGTMTGTGTLMVNEAGNTDDYSTQYSISGGTTFTNLTVNFSGTSGQFIHTAIAPLGFKVSGGNKLTLTINLSATTNGLTLSNNSTVEVSSGNSLAGTVTGTGTIRVMHTGNADDLTQNYTGTVTYTNLTVDFGGTALQQVTSTPSLAGFVISNNSAAGVVFNANETTTSGTVVNGSSFLTVSAAYTLSGGVSGSGTITVTNNAGGNTLTNQYKGTISTSTLSVIYTASGAVQVGTGTYYSIKVSNGSGNTLSGDVTVSHGLDLTNGKLDISGHNLTINSGVSISGASSTNYIKISSGGTVIAKSVTSATLPIGDEYAPVIIASGGGADYTIGLTPSITSNGGATRTADAVAITWTITANATVTPTFTFQWPSTSELTSFDRTNSDVAQRVSPSGNWALLSTPSNATNAGGGNWSQTANATSMTSGTAYDFGIGDNIAPLPVKLISFTATLINKEVELNWATASEINNSYFTIERSADGKNFDDIMTKPGAGNSQVVLHYAAYDVQPLPGVSYYRLKQTDFNNASETFNIVSVNNKVSMQDFNITAASPTVFSDHFTLNYQVPASGNVRILVTNMLGQTVQDVTVPASTGYNNFEVNNTMGWKPGIYVAQIHYNNWVNYIKVDKTK